MKTPEQIVEHLEKKIKNVGDEAVCYAKRFMDSKDERHKERSQKLFGDIDYYRSLIKFIKE